MIRPNSDFFQFHKSTREFRWFNGSSLRLFSLDNPSGILGRGFDLIVVDEAAEVADEVWTRVLRPCLSDTNGRGIFISTPLFRSGFFFELFHSQAPDTESFHIPSSKNPFLAPGELEAVKRELPSTIYRQQFEAEFLTDGGSVFRNLAEISSSDPLPDGPEDGKQYAGGLDLAKSEDFTVLLVMEATDRRVVAGYRWQNLSWPVQCDRISQIAKQWGLESLYTDSTGLGDAIVDDLRFHHDAPVRPVTFTNAEKARLVNQLSLACEQGSLSIPGPECGELWRVLRREMEIYTSTLLPGGSLRYSHPDGQHDDAVTSLFLCLDAAIRGTSQLASTV
jgi:hypothetical protein